MERPIQQDTASRHTKHRLMTSVKERFLLAVLTRTIQRITSKHWRIDEAVHKHHRKEEESRDEADEGTTAGGDR